jgi:hypothetical protein
MIPDPEQTRFDRFILTMFLIGYAGVLVTFVVAVMLLTL